jgi:hypothetical protein
MSALSDRLGAGARLLLALLTLGFAAPAIAEPALWVIKDADTTLYVFGSLHALKPGVEWRSAKFDQAFEASAEVVFEAVVPDDPKALAPLIQTLGLDPTGGLSAKLAPDTRARLAEAASAYGLPPAALERMRPWLAATTLGSAPLLRSGWDPRLGPDLLLQVEAKAKGKAVLGLETVEQQARFLADLPEPRQIEALTATLDGLPGVVPRVEEVQAAWLAGDQARLAALGAPSRAIRDAAFDAIIRTDRNRAWAGWIKARLERPGMAMIVVGAGHLFGQDSLGEVLAQQGVLVQRY